MNFELIDNINKTLKDDLAMEIRQDSKISIAAACFLYKNYTNENK